MAPPCRALASREGRFLGRLRRMPSGVGTTASIVTVVLPSPSCQASLQAARVFRLLRLIRLLRLAVLARRLLSAEGVRDAAVLALLTVLGGGAAFAAVEQDHHRVLRLLPDGHARRDGRPLQPRWVWMGRAGDVS